MWGESQDKKLRFLVKYCAFNPTVETIVSADASSFRLGAVLRLRQPEDKVLCPVAYISRVLSNTKKNYAQIEKEALAVT